MDEKKEEREGSLPLFTPVMPPLNRWKAIARRQFEKQALNILRKKPIYMEMSNNKLHVL